MARRAHLSETAVAVAFTYDNLATMCIFGFVEDVARVVPTFGDLLEMLVSLVRTGCPVSSVGDSSRFATGPSSTTARCGSVAPNTSRKRATSPRDSEREPGARGAAYDHGADDHWDVVIDVARLTGVRELGGSRLSWGYRADIELLIA